MTARPRLSRKKPYPPSARSGRRSAKGLARSALTSRCGCPRVSKRYNPFMTDRLLQGKSALITGGARRLGRATALAMARAGADVAITFLHSAREAQHTVIDLSSFGVRAVALRCAITDEKSVKATIRQNGRELGSSEEH